MAKQRERTGVYGGGPARNEGGRPECGSLAAVGGPQPVATDNSNTSISSADHTPFPKIPIPFSEDTHMSSTDSQLQNTLSPPTGALPQYVKIKLPPEFPEPGTTTKSQPTLGKKHARTDDGKVIPHERSEEIAEQVARWVACGAGDNEIAGYLNIRVGQLRKSYKKELETGQFENNMDVAGTILNLAKAGVPQMSIFWAKSRMGWRDSDKNEQNNAALLNIHIHT